MLPQISAGFGEKLLQDIIALCSVFEQSVDYQRGFLDEILRRERGDTDD